MERRHGFFLVNPFFSPLSNLIDPTFRGCDHNLASPGASQVLQQDAGHFTFRQQTIPRINKPLSIVSDNLSHSFVLNQSRSSAMKVTIRSWHAVATWRWDMPEDDVCGICRVQFDGTCPTCKYPGDHCNLCMFISGATFARLNNRAKAECFEDVKDKANEMDGQ